MCYISTAHFPHIYFCKCLLFKLCSMVIRKKESFQVELQSRGGLGLQLSYRTDNDGVVEVSRVSTGIALPGSNLPVTYEITGLRKGKVKITFYETQPWNKNFTEIIQKEVGVEVTD